MIKGKRIGAGQTAEIFCWGDRQVIKLFFQNISAAWIDYEAKVTEIAYQAGLPAPQVQGITELEGRKGIIIERFTGNSM